MNKDKIKDISQSLSDEFSKIYNTLNSLSLSFLLRHTDNPLTWSSYQKSVFDEYTKKLKKLTEYYLEEYNQVYERALTLSYNDSINNEIIIDKEKKEVNLVIPKKVTDSMVQIGNQNKELFMLLAASLATQHSKKIDEIDHDYNITIGNFGGGYKNNYQKEVGVLNNTNALYDSIAKTIQKYEKVENVPKITYSNGRKFSFKAYMEMNSRTTLQQEANNFQLESGSELGVVFYLCSSFGDSAKDHVDYQGKIYYDENWNSSDFTDEQRKAINKFIIENKLLSRQSVENQSPFLGSRPNCRHTFNPITIDEAITKNPKNLLKKYGLNLNGKYEEKKANQREELRYLERKIRDYKEQRDNLKVLANNAKSKEEISALNEQLNKSKAKVSDYQKKARDLVKESDFLIREYDRENYKVITQDLGYRFKNKN